MITVSYSFCRAYSIESRATFTGSPVVSPGADTASPPADCTPFSGAYTGTPARSPTTSSCVTAFGRCKSAATSSGVWPESLSQ